MKYAPTYPGCFADPQEARSYFQSFFPWYNTHHRHSGIGLLTPDAVHYGRANEIQAARQRVLNDVYTQHPERFVNGPPRPPQVPGEVWINQPQNTIECERVSKLSREVIESAVSSRRKLEGTISPTPNGNVHDVWPGQWDFSDLYGAGGNILFGHGLGDGRSQVYVFGGIRRMWTEFASGSTNPETGTAGEDRERLARWPWAIGAGTTLHLKWPLDFRVRYSRSLTDWIVVDEGARLDYRYAAGGVVFFSLGVHVFD